MNINRFLFYFLLCTLVNVVNFLRDLQYESPIEALKYVPYIFPTILTFTIGMYYLRLYILNLPFVISIIPKGRHGVKWAYWLLLIIIKSLLLALIAMVLSELFFPGYYDKSITSLFFWGNFMAIFCVILFAYVMEAFLESEAEKQEFVLKLNEIDNERTMAKYQALKNQLNPHFLFNSFNSLSALMDIDIEKADNFLQELSNVYRYNLDHNEELVVSLSKEISLIRSYMVLQRIRFRESIQITYQIDESKTNYLIPPMTLELLVENAIKHNVVEKTNPLHITIATKENYIVVENNFQPRGKAIDKDSSFGIGLENLKNQYELIHKEVPTFKVENNKYIANIPLITPNI